VHGTAHMYSYHEMNTYQHEGKCTSTILWTYPVGWGVNSDMWQRSCPSVRLWFENAREKCKKI